MATIFVSQDFGSDDTGDGTQANPVATIKKAINLAVENDTIQILDSAVYRPGGTLSADRIFLSESLNFTAAAGQEPTIDGTDARGNDLGEKPAFHGSTSPSGKVLGFTGFIFNSFTGSANPICNADNRVTLQFSQCTFQNMLDVPIFQSPADATSDDPNALDRCQILPSTHFKLIDGQNADEHFLFTNSTFHQTASEAGPASAQNYIDDGSGNRSNGIVRNCSLSVNMEGGRTAIRFGVVENTIIKNENLGGTYTNTKAIDAHSLYSNNCVFGNFGTNEVDNTSGGATDGGGLVTSDPLFQSDNPLNFKLQPSSPCIGVGKTIASITVDLEGNSRTAPYSIGAFEFDPPAMTDDGSETYSRKFGSTSFEIHATANRLATRGFIDNKENRQAPFSVTVSGPPTIREKIIPYKNET